jgi:hypothetical protein
MQAIFIYNPHNSTEVSLTERVKLEFANYLVEVEAVDFQEVKNLFKISTTPALIIVSEALQGEHLLDEADNGQLKIAAELWKAIQEEEAVIHGIETNRIGDLIEAEVKKRTAKTPAKKAIK